MERTAFGNILARVVDRLPGAIGAIFLDWEGEAVDMTDYTGATQLELTGAHWSIIYYQVRSLLAKSDVPSPTEIFLGFESQAVLIRRVTDDYLALIVMKETTHLGRTMELMRQAADLLQKEM